MIKLVDNKEIIITSSEVEWYVSPGTFERKLAEGYTTAVFGEGEWVYDTSKRPLRVSLAGGHNYKIPGMWAFFHPVGRISAVVNPKTCIIHENGDHQNTPLERRERTFGLFGRFGVRRSYESYLRTYKIQMGEPFDLQGFMDSEVYGSVMRRWQQEQEWRQQNAIA